MLGDKIKTLDMYEVEPQKVVRYLTSIGKSYESSIDLSKRCSTYVDLPDSMSITLINRAITILKLGSDSSEEIGDCTVTVYSNGNLVATVVDYDMEFGSAYLSEEFYKKATEL